MKTVTFDWDGTLANTIPDIVANLQYFALDAGLRYPTEDEILPLIGTTVENILSSLFFNQKVSRPVGLISRYREISERSVPKLFDNVPIILTLLKNQDYRLCIASSRSRQGLDRQLALTELDGFFDETIVAEESMQKPHPEMLIRTSTNIYVGDALIDAQMAAAAGIDFVGVACGAATKGQFIRAGVKTIIPNVKFLLEIL